MKPLAKPIHVDIPKLIFIRTIRKLNLEHMQLPFWPQVTQFKSSKRLPTLLAINRFGYRLWNTLHICEMFVSSFLSHLSLLTIDCRDFEEFATILRRYLRSYKVFTIYFELASTGMSI